MYSSNRLLLLTDLLSLQFTSEQSLSDAEVSEILPEDLEALLLLLDAFEALLLDFSTLYKPSSSGEGLRCLAVGFD